MFDFHDRLWVYLLGLKQVQVRLLGQDIGFFYQAQSGAQTLFCTLPDLETSPLRYRFHLPTDSQSSPAFCQCVKGWPSWMQVVNPRGEDEEALWLCVTQAYQHAARPDIHQPLVPQGGSYVAQPL